MTAPSDQSAHDFDVIIVGSGPSGSAYARIIHEEAPQLSVLMVEVGPSLTSRPGVHVKNITEAHKREAAQQASQGPETSFAPQASIPGSGRPGTFLLSTAGQVSEMPAAAMSSNVGGMGAHWTCACPRPGGSERIAFLDDAIMDAALADGERLLAVTNEAFKDAPLSSVVRERLAAGIHRTGSAAVQPMPLAVRRDDDGTVTWSGTDVVLGPLAETTFGTFELRTETLCKRVLLSDDGQATGVALSNLRTGAEYTVDARAVVVAADALRTPQVLFASGLSLPALGRYLNDQPQVITAVRLPSDSIDAEPAAESAPGATKLSGVSWVPFTDDEPFHGQVMQMDASPIKLADDDQILPGSIVGLGWFCASETVPDNRVEFSAEDVDHYGMPRMSIHYKLTPKDLATIEAAKAAVTRAGQALGTFLDDRPPFLLPAGTSLHYQGSVRMGQHDDGQSVCGPDSHVWGTQGLYVAGNGVIPTSTACNPTLTSVALAVLGARAIISQLV
ncbi:GMC oxidoreductase [Arthrobacter sp. R3-55]